MTQYRNNHYVPVWYQDRFFPSGMQEKKFFYLDLAPDPVAGRPQIRRRSEMRWGPRNCFAKHDLYTTKHGTASSTEIEEMFFGAIDASARPALDYFDCFTHPGMDSRHFDPLLQYMSIQKLRTPKGLAHLSRLLGTTEQNEILFRMQQLQQLFCANWTECIWSIADASKSETKFILSDHPVTVYNEGCYPGSTTCRDFGDPDVWQSGTHTLFPLSLNRLLILTNLSWVRYPYGNPRSMRPNPVPFRRAILDFRSIQTGRKLTAREVTELNYIIKLRAYRYVAAAKKEWLYPEQLLGRPSWDTFGKSYLLMPDPRSVSFSRSTHLVFGNAKSESLDAYGRSPIQEDYDSELQASREWETFLAFQGEFARKFGPVRRGRSFEFDQLSTYEDDKVQHAYHLGLEQKHKKHRYR